MRYLRGTDIGLCGGRHQLLKMPEPRHSIGAKRLLAKHTLSTIRRDGKVGSWIGEPRELACRVPHPSPSLFARRGHQIRREHGLSQMC